MNVLAQHWEKLVFVVMLIIAALLLALNLTGGEPVEVSLQKKSASLEMSDLAVQFQTTIQRAKEKAPATLTTNVFTHDLLQYSTDSKKLMPKWGLIDPETGANVSYHPDADKDGMKNDWEQKYELSWTDPSDAEQDKDGDGLTNLQEFEKETDPTDPTDPNLITEEYRLVEIYQPKRDLLFKGALKLSGGNSYQLEYKGNLNMKKEGESINDDDGNPIYKIVSYTRITTNIFNESLGAKREKDRSELKIEDVNAGKTFKLVVKQPSVYDYFEAKMVRRSDQKESIVQIGDTVPLNAVDEDATVKTLNAEDNEAVFTIGTLDYTVQTEK